MSGIVNVECAKTCVSKSERFGSSLILMRKNWSGNNTSAKAGRKIDGSRNQCQRHWRKCQNSTRQTRQPALQKAHRVASMRAIGAVCQSGQPLIEVMPTPLAQMPIAKIQITRQGDQRFRRRIGLLACGRRLSVAAGPAVK